MKDIARYALQHLAGTIAQVNRLNDCLPDEIARIKTEERSYFDNETGRYEMAIITLADDLVDVSMNLSAAHRQLLAICQMICQESKE